MPIKHPTCKSAMLPCQLTKSELAHQFTHYLIQNRHLKPPGIIQKDQLIQLFDFYQSQLGCASTIKSWEILAILDESHLLKKKSIHSSRDKTPFAEFRNNVFGDDLLKYLKFLKKLDPSSDDLECKMCKQTFTNSVERNEHLITDIHKLRDTYRKDRKSFPTKLRNVEVSSLPLMRLDLKEHKMIDVTLTNVSGEPYSLIVHDVFELVHLNGVKTVYTCPRTIEQGESFNLSLHVQFLEYGAKLFPIVLKVSRADFTDMKELLIEAKFNVMDKELDSLAPVAPYKPPSKNKIVFNYADVVKGEYLPSTMNCLSQKQFLHLYKIPNSLNSILNHGFKVYDTMSRDEITELQFVKSLLCDEEKNKVLPNVEALTAKNYVARFHLLMWIEEHQAHKDMQFYNQLDVELITTRKKQGLYGIEVLGLSEGRPSVLRGDIVYIRRKYDNEVKYEGVVHAIEQNTIFVAPSIKFKDFHKDNEKVDIEFTFTRQPLRYSHRALDQLKQRKVTSAMFPQIMEKNCRKVKLKPMFNKLIAENEQQSQAVKNIVENRAYPAPYILFGPPGTGKTATLVEAITQVWSIIPNSRVCVCAPSNSAADVITERLLKHISPIEILRLYGLSRSDQEISKQLEKCSNFDRFKKELFIPSEMQIKSKRIVIMTPVTAGRLVNAGINGGFFDYVFMDEAGHAVEVEMLIPIVGFLTKAKKTDLMGSLVLAGDPKQLGPVVRSTLASSLGFDMSLLERVMSQCEIYKKNPEYNPQVITKLINNYRSHKEILHIPNLCFYDNELEAKGPPEVITCASEWKELHDKDFPMIFHGVVGFEEREESSPSYFNRNEMQIVSYYVENLLGCQFKSHEVTQQDIGVITPYRKQVQRIRKYFEGKNWENIEVASVEEFQGKEKLIIIISTVRSRVEFVATDYQFGLGFLRNAKRFNVALTRAIALLIIIGNPDILQCDPNWRKLIEYCILKNSYKGIKPSGTVPMNFDPNEKLALDLSMLTKNSDMIPNDEKPGFSRYD